MDCGKESLVNQTLSTRAWLTRTVVVRAWLMDCGKESLVNGLW